MSDRKDFFFGQPLGEADLDGAFDQQEQALWNFATDLGVSGLITGGQTDIMGSGEEINPTEVRVKPFRAYDKLGRRLFSTDDILVDISTATDGSSTLPASGDWRWVTIVARFGRVLSDSRTDGLGSPVKFNKAEALVSTGDTNSANVGKLQVLKGTALAISSGQPTRPTIGANDVLICDLLVQEGGISTAGDISTARTDRFALRTSPSPSNADLFEFTPTYQLLWEACNDEADGTKGRIYMAPRGSGLVFTYNARWNAATQLWQADLDDDFAGVGVASKIALGPRGIDIHRRQNAGTDWTDNTRDPAGWDSLLSFESTGENAFAVLDGHGNLTGNGTSFSFSSVYGWFTHGTGSEGNEQDFFRGQGFTWPKTFEVTPSSVTLADISSIDHNVTDTTIGDINAFGGTFAVKVVPVGSNQIPFRAARRIAGIPL